MPSRAPAGRPIWLSAALVALAAVVFAPVRHFPFVSWDDPFYLADNPVVRQGLTGAGIMWALTSPDRFYWHPLTWLSHMTDVQVFGLDPGAHHVVNLVLHTLATLLLFLVLRRMTGHDRKSAVVAALFAIHPLHVESVAWVAERKDVLSGVFFMLTLATYATYARAGGPTRYTGVIICFALGLASKPTLTVLPLILFLLDEWPLERRMAWRASVLEKIPLLALSAAAGVATLVTQANVGALQGLDTIPLRTRLANAAVSSVTYMAMAVWPSGLAAFYPYRPIAPWRVILSVLVLAGVSYAVIRVRRERPYLFVGWWWYLLMLLPVIGLIQAGSQSMADRFTYLPLIGLLIAAVWGLADVLAGVRAPKAAAAALACGVIAANAAVARTQVGYWKDSETLWRRATQAVANNDLAHANLGVVLADAGRTDEAIAHLAEARRLVEAPGPEYSAFLHERLGVLHARRAATRYRAGDVAGAIGDLEEALRAAPAHPGAAKWHYNRAAMLNESGRPAEAVTELEAALAADPAYEPARQALAELRRK